MINEIHEISDYFLGLTQKDLNLFNMINRSILVYILGILILNLLNKRFVAEKTSFDIIIRFIIGNALANAILGNSPYFETLGMVLFIIFINWILSLISFYNKRAEEILKGKPAILFNNNKFNLKAMRKFHFTKDDIKSEVRKITGLDNFEPIKEIFIENSGELSVIPKDNNAKIHKQLDSDND